MAARSLSAVLRLVGTLQPMTYTYSPRVVTIIDEPCRHAPERTYHYRSISHCYLVVIILYGYKNSLACKLHPIPAAPRYYQNLRQHYKLTGHGFQNKSMYAPSPRKGSHSHWRFPRYWCWLGVRAGEERCQRRSISNQ